MTQTTEHPNVAIVKKFYEAYGKGDLDAIRSLLAPNVVWYIPGHHPLAGYKHGADEVFAFFQQLAKANFKADTLYIGGDDNYVVDYHRGYGEYGNVKLDILWCLAYKIENGKIIEATDLSADQHAADIFFWSVYPLKPIPDRLA